MDRFTNPQRTETDDYVPSAMSDGKLIKLPCRVGDTLYRIWLDDGLEDRYIEPCIVECIVLCRDEKVLLKGDSYDYVICEASYLDTYSPTPDNYVIFSKKEEAEAALEEMKETEVQ